MLSFLGMLAFLIAVLDIAFALFGWPLTTLSWSPVVFVALGFLFVTLEAWQLETGPFPDRPADRDRS